MNTYLILALVFWVIALFIFLFYFESKKEKGYNNAMAFTYCFLLVSLFFLLAAAYSQKSNSGFLPEKGIYSNY
jgi:heme/copper-type cytochrome/quinol oxidase subunit 4